MTIPDNQTQPSEPNDPSVVQVRRAENMKLQHVRIDLAEANAFVAAHHRHHKPVVGHVFSLGAVLGEKIVGVAIVGRPIARIRDNGATAEVTRLCTDGTKDACSFLYGAAARAAFALGFKKIGTYILASEPGNVATGRRLAVARLGRRWELVAFGSPARGQTPDARQVVIRADGWLTVRALRRAVSKPTQGMMMIEWISTKDRMPAERGVHLLYSEEQDACVGPIPWIPSGDGKGGAWCDIFATKEAGFAYSPPMVSHWAVWNNPPAGSE